ncbi:hypothetical protein OIDMADRAFT_181170 [Oidiodendron maius Zn]|uniref:CNH domain-containing protein n=1 Tax=Oidiodendron maius (strain Zn) TaxID=913774 RepID=A0A0C3DCX0_OIDMZ|nr:hypothetical protein OIDMADRAFT_181170 [Oidiodendron maius Zn]
MEQVEVNLDNLGREPIFKGDLYRTVAGRLVWLKSHAQLFDHYFVLAKTMVQPDDTRNEEIHDVSKLVGFLLCMHDDPLVRSPVPGFGAAAAAVARLTRAQSFPVENTNLNSASDGILSAVKPEEDTRLLYPFRIKHLGKPESYTLYAPTAANQRDWCEKIIEAKERHVATLLAKNAEPFQLRVITSQSFRYSIASSTRRGSGVHIRGSSLDRAIRAMERQCTDTAAGYLTSVHCATEFLWNGQSKLAIGADDGIYISEGLTPRKWTRTVQIKNVTQIAILEILSLCLVIADKSLIAYPLDIVDLQSNASESSQDSARRAPRKLSGARDVSFFATASMNERILIFYKERDKPSSIFKVLEPVLEMSSEEKPKLSRGLRSNSGNTESFSLYDEFYIPVECYAINLFQKSIAISTRRGFELLSLDKKVPMSIPDFRQAAIATSGVRLAGQKPLGMFRVSDTEFLLCYEECGVYMDRNGEISRSVVLEFAGKAKTAAMYGTYLVLFHSDFVEVHSALTGRLRQVIAGRDVRCLDFGVAATEQDGQPTLKFAMEHPEMADCQLVLEMVLDEMKSIHHPARDIKKV